MNKIQFLGVGDMVVEPFIELEEAEIICEAGNLLAAKTVEATASVVNKKKAVIRPLATFIFLLVIAK